MPTPAEIAANLRRTAKPAGYRLPDAEIVPPDETDIGPSSEFEAGADKEADRVARREVAFGHPEADAESAGEARAAELEAQRAGTPVTYGGEALPSAFAHPLEASRALYDATAGRLLPAEVTGALGRVGGAFERGIEGQGKVVGALLPQRTDTPYQAEQRVAAEEETGRETDEATRRLDAAIAGLHLPPATRQALLQDQATIEQDPDPATPTALGAPPVVARSDAQAAAIAAHPGLASQIDALNAARTHQISDERAREDAAALESPASYALRLLGAPQSAAVGLAEGALTDRSLDDALASRISEGEGFLGGGRDLGRYLGGQVGHPTAGAVVGGTLGFLGDLATPGIVGKARDLAGLGTAESALSEAERAVPRELRPSALERAFTGPPPDAGDRDLQQIRDQVSGIPELHAVDAHQLAGATGAPIADASAHVLASGVARVAVPPPPASNQIALPLGGLAVENNAGIALVRGLANTLGKPLEADELGEALTPALAALGERARALLDAPPAPGTARELEAVVSDVAAAVGVPIAPEDARRALSGAYLASRTWEVVSDVVARSADQAVGSLRAELAVGPREFLGAVRVRAPELAQTIDRASAIGDTFSSLGTALSDRALVAARLAKLNAATSTAPIPVRRAWTLLQQTIGYGTPLIDDAGAPLVGATVAALGAGAVHRTTDALRSGMLSGFAVANPFFHVKNFATAPAIVASTLGPRFAAASILSWDGVRVLRAMDGVPSAVGQVIVETAERSYTAGDIARLVAANGVSRSQAKVELAARGIEALTEFAQRASDGRFLSHLKSLGGYGDNIWAAVANSSDNFFRINVLTAALRDGRPEQEALTLARESLFDYGNITDFERNYLGRVVWFWSFRRGNYRALMKNILSHPTRLSAIASAQNALSESTPHGDDTTFLATESYAENSPQWRMVNDREAGLRYAINGPPIPQVQAIEDLTHALQLAGLMAQDAHRSGVGAAGKDAFDAALTQVNPLIQMAFASGGVNISHGPDAPLSSKPDTRLIWYLQEIPGMWQAAVAQFDLEEVPEGSGQWRIGSDNGRLQWADMMSALELLGAKRPLQEYAPMFAAAQEALGGESSIHSPQLGNAPGMSAWDRLGNMAGLLTPTVEPAFENTSDRNEQARERAVLP